MGRFTSHIFNSQSTIDKMENWQDTRGVVVNTNLRPFLIPTRWHSTERAKSNSGSSGVSSLSSSASAGHWHVFVSWYSTKFNAERISNFTVLFPSISPPSRIFPFRVREVLSKLKDFVFYHRMTQVEEFLGPDCDGLARRFVGDLGHLAPEAEAVDGSAPMRSRMPCAILLWRAPAPRSSLRVVGPSLTHSILCIMKLTPSCALVLVPLPHARLFIPQLTVLA